MLELDVLTADTRDPKRIADDIGKLGVKVVREKMNSGDYGSLSKRGKTWLMERKEANDFLSCLADGSLYDQMLRLTQDADVAFLLPEGRLIPSESGKMVRTHRGKREWNYMATYHAFIELACLGAIILPFVPPQFTAAAIVQVMRTMNGNLKYIVEKNRRPLTLTNKVSPARRFMEPMIGKVVLDNLSSAYPNLWMIFRRCMEDPDEVQTIPHVGPTTVKRIQDLMVRKI